jgi:hypothetical protein
MTEPTNDIHDQVESPTTVRVIFEGAPDRLWDAMKGFLEGRSRRRTRLTPDQANALRHRASQGETIATLMVDFGISRETIRNVLNKKTFHEAQ